MSTRLESASSADDSVAVARSGREPLDSPADERWVAVARILRPRGRKGEVIAEALSDFRDRFQGLKRGFIEGPGKQPEPANIAEAWWHEDRLILRFVGVDSISRAESLRGRLLFVPREERMTLGERQYYQDDLIGCEVVKGRESQPFGRVTGVERTGGVDLLLVARVSPEDKPEPEILIPFAEELCSEIDVRARRIVVQPPDGLLELNEGSAESSEA